MRESLLLHVATVDVEYGFAVCVSGGFIVVTETRNSCLALYDVASRALVGRFGSKGSGRGQFNFDGYSGLCAGVEALPTVFIADGSNKRVSEHTLPSGECVRLLGLTHLQGPRGVDANCSHIAVSDYGRGHSSVLLFAADAVDETPPLWVFGGAHGPSPAELPAGTAAVP